MIQGRIQQANFSVVCILVPLHFCHSGVGIHISTAHYDPWGAEDWVRYGNMCSPGKSCNLSDKVSFVSGKAQLQEVLYNLVFLLENLGEAMWDWKTFM